MFPPVQILKIEGRYPGNAVFRSRNIVPILVRTEDNEFRLRLDDVRLPDAWIEITIDTRELIREALTLN